MNRTYISGGMIYDGTGRDPFCGDIVIKDTKIEEVLPPQNRSVHRYGRPAYPCGRPCGDAGICGCAQAL